MKTIHKHTLRAADEQKLTLGRGAEVLSVQAQHGNIQVWVTHGGAAGSAVRTFWIKGTGNPCDDVPDDATFLGTVQLANGALVFHVFYK